MLVNINVFTSYKYIQHFYFFNRTGKIKGIERFLGTVETLQESLIEVTSGQAKYEHQHRAIVWRIPRLPKEGQGKLYKYFIILKTFSHLLMKTYIK